MRSINLIGKRMVLTIIIKKDFIINIKFFNMGNRVTIKKIGFEDVQHVIKQGKGSHLLISTLHLGDQGCLIHGTISAHDEESLINKHLRKTGLTIIVYGKNSTDESIFKKYEQLLTLGFINVYVYTGGIFQWLLLQDIYGKDEFPTTHDELDVLKYRPSVILTRKLLQDID